MMYHRVAAINLLMNNRFINNLLCRSSVRALLMGVPLPLIRARMLWECQCCYACYCLYSVVIVVLLEHRIVTTVYWG